MQSASSLKIVILGDEGAGKTKLVFRFLHDQFDPTSIPTDVVQIYSYSVEGINLTP